MHGEVKHEHAGKSSRGLIDAERVLDVLEVKAGEVFLDAGCGDGYFSLTASERVGSQGRVYAVDIHPESLMALNKEIKDKNLSNIEIIEADITKGISIRDNTVDIYFLANVLHGLDTEAAGGMLKEAKRILKEGGRMAVIEFKKIEPPPGPPVSIRLSPDEVERFLYNNGFKKIVTRDIGEYHYLVIGQL
jgi:ubiquinone/menaquinone biosynthesis C-methylase UbiE